MSLVIEPVTGLPTFEPHDDLVDILVRQLACNKQQLNNGDVLVVAQKIVSKIEQRQVNLNDVEASSEAAVLAAEVEKDPRLVHLILQESAEVVRKKPGVLITRHRLGQVGAHAGIDQSNIRHADGGSALLLPVDPDASARKIHADIKKKLHVDVGVLISDSANRPWRLGTIGIAIGAANTTVLDDRRGGFDRFGRELKVTMSNRADSIATAAMLVMGETDENVPIAIVRGLDNQSTSESARMTNRPVEDDLFR